MDKSRRIVLLGKTGAGKSSLANTIFGEPLFPSCSSANSGTSKCHAEAKSVNGRSISLIDTPGVFDTAVSENNMKPEIIRSIVECAPGPHAFLIMLKVEKFTSHEQDVLKKIRTYFSEEVLKYAVIVFSHGDELQEGTTIQEFVSQSQGLSDLVRSCGGRCHVVDNKYWKSNQQDEYRSNGFQVTGLLNTIETMVANNNGRHYTNDMLETVEEAIKEEMRLSPGNMSAEERRKEAKSRVFKRFLIQLVGMVTGALLGAFFGVVASIQEVTAALLTSSTSGKLTAAMAAVTGVFKGGKIGYDAARGAQTPMEGAEMAADAFREAAINPIQE